MNAPLDLEPTQLQQWNLSVQKGFGDWLASVSYLGNRTLNLWRGTELNPAVPIAGATTGNTNQRRVLFLQDPIDGQAYGTIGHVDDTGRGNYHGLLLSLQKRMAEQRQRAVELDDLALHVRSRDQRDHRADHRRPEQP